MNFGVPIPALGDDQFLALAVERYLDKFLELKRRHSKVTWAGDCLFCGDAWGSKGKERVLISSIVGRSYQLPKV